MRRLEEANVEVVSLHRRCDDRSKCLCPPQLYQEVSRKKFKKEKEKKFYKEKIFQKENFEGRGKSKNELKMVDSEESNTGVETAMGNT